MSIDARISGSGLEGGGVSVCQGPAPCVREQRTQSPMAKEGKSKARVLMDGKRGHTIDGRCKYSNITDMLTAIRSAVAAHVASFDASHDLAHIDRVTRMALTLAREEGLTKEADVLAIHLAALLHDADDYKYAPSVPPESGGTVVESASPARGLPVARAIMQRAGVGDDTALRVCEIISRVSYSGEVARGALGDAAPLDDVAAAIVQDADRLDAIGALGIARAFTFGGARLRPLQSTIAHFHDKLLRVAGLMKTNAGRARAVGRHEFMVAFLHRFEQEWRADA